MFKLHKGDTMLYFGTKMVDARPMTAHAYEQYMDENIELVGDDEPGYLVEYVFTGRPNHPGHDNYVSWSPAEVFDSAYESNGSLSFGHAVKALKQGAKVSRMDWNGKNIFLYLVGGNEYPVERNAGSAIAGYFPKDMIPYCPYIAMLTAQNDVVPWVASQSDILVDDWYIVE